MSDAQGNDPALRIEELTRKIAEYERWFGVLDNQMRVLERERQKLSAVVNNSDAGFLVVNGSQKIVWANETFRARFSAIDSNRLQGSACHEALCRRDEACGACPAAAPFRTGAVAHHELKLESESGSRHIYATSVPILSPSAVIEETLVMLQDVTDLSVLRRSQEALRASEERFRSIFLNAAAGMATLATDGSFLQVNPALCGFLGYPEEELSRLNIEAVTYPPDRAETQRVLEEVARGARLEVVTEQRYQRKDGGVVWGQISSAWVLDADGQPAYGIALVQDITERRRAEEALRDSKALVQLLQQAAVASNEASGLEEAIRLCIDLVCAFTGWPVGHACLVAPDGSSELVPTGLWHMETPERFAAFRARMESRRIPAGAGLPGRALSTGRAAWVTDITLDPDARAVAADTAVRAGFCFPILVGREVAGVLQFYAAEPVEPDHRLLEVMGHIGAQLGRVIERQRAADAIRVSEEQLRQAQKMEAIGTLAGGVAHDFNNILTGILGHAQLLRASASNEEAVRRSAETIERAGRRAAELTQQLLGFARKGKHQNTPVDLQATIGEAIALLGHTLDKRIRISRHFRCERPFALGDPVQIQQVILNLAVNARDAMPEGGELTFVVERMRLEAGDTQRHPGFAPGEYVAIAVTDTGCGIPDEIRPRIFEPFFTTKEQGKGTGMGLAMVYGIVKNHGGFIDVESVMGAGTTLRILLPLASASPEKESSAGAGVRTGSGRILVVDDEAIIREIATQFLTRMGYSVETASDGQEAVERYARAGERPIDLVILDMVMPRMGGRDCFRALKGLNPGVRAILSSGYGLNEAVQEILDEGALAFVQKPYEISQISEAVEAALKGERAAAS